MTGLLSVTGCQDAGDRVRAYLTFPTSINVPAIIRTILYKNPFACKEKMDKILLL